MLPQEEQIGGLRKERANRDMETELPEESGFPQETPQGTDSASLRAWVSVDTLCMSEKTCALFWWRML